MSYEDIDSVVEEIKAANDYEVDRFPTDFVSRHTGNISRCLDDGNKPYQIKSGDKYSINFEEPAYIEEIEIIFSKSLFGVPIEIFLHDELHNRDHSFKWLLDDYSKVASIAPRKVSSGFSIHLHPGLYEILKRKTVDIEKINVYGYFSSDFEEISKTFNTINQQKTNAITYIERERERVAKKEDDLNQKEEKINALEDAKRSELKRIEENISKSQIDYNEWKKDLNKLEKEITAAESKKNQLNDQINVSETNKRNIESEITSGTVALEINARKTKEAEEKLKQLTSNVNLFSEEFASFSDHGAKQTRTFILLSLIPILIITFLTLHLLSGAVDLSIKYSKEENIDLLTIFVTRIPYILVCASILTICYSLTLFLFKRISYIYAEKLDFSKISIIAKDVATAASNSTSLPDDHLYEARTYLKVEMLKSYLSGNIGQFAYTQRTLATIIEEDKKATNSMEKLDDEYSSIDKDNKE